MSEHLQSGYHPDADQISAFVEHALPAHDREQMLDHLAACDECRAVVAMSLPEIEEPEPARLPHTSTGKSWQSSWSSWSGWTLTWSLAWALAAVVLAVIFIRHTVFAPNTQTPNQIAGAHSPEPPVPQFQPPAFPENIPSRGSPEKPAGSSHAIPAGNESLESQPHADAAAKSSSVASAPMQARNLAPLDQKMDQRAQAAPASPSLGMVSGLRAAQPASPESRAQNLAPLSPASAAAPPASAPPAATGGKIADDVAVTTAAPIQPAPSTAAGADIALDEVQLARLIQVQNPLPSHLPVLSLATQARRMVAIDTHNAVFLSMDAGKHWKAIQAPWPGRAVRASLVEFPALNKSYAAFHGVAPAVVAGIAASQEKAGDALRQLDQPAAAAACCSLMGTVTDRTGAVISDASVSVTDPSSHDVRMVKTDNAGHYLVGGLAPGTYKLEAQAAGFLTQELAAVSVAGSHPAVADLSLDIGAASETVTVEASSNEILLDKKKNPKAKSSANATAVFDIVTDNGDHWTSTDGIAWKHM